MSRIVAVIPARWKSTRFPGKPLHLLAGKPLVQHVWERCARAQLIDRVVIATDDMRIAETAFAFGAEVALTSARHQSGTDRVAEVAKKLRGVSHVINVQGDEPMIEPRLINALARELRGDRTLAMITAATLFKKDEPVDNPNAVKVVIDQNRNALYFSRRPIPFIRDGTQHIRVYRHQGIYGYSTAFLAQFVRWKPTMLEKAEQLEQLRALEHGMKIRVVLTKWPSVGVDTPEDAEAVARAMKLK